MDSMTSQKVLWFATGVTALVAAGSGVASPQLYEGLVTDRIMPGVLAQDLLSIPASLGLLGIAWNADETALRARLLVTGILGYLFYAFGIYSIERIYNELYLLYLAIFGLSAYGIVYSLGSLDAEQLEMWSVPTWLRNVSAGYLLLNAAVFVGIWTSHLVPLMRRREKIEFLYSIYILDLCFIMPAFVVAAVLALRGRPFGRATILPLLIAGFAVLFPLALAEMLKPVWFAQPTDVGALAMFAGLSGVFGVLAILYVTHLQTNSES
jgi:hypothetical protein